MISNAEPWARVAVAVAASFLGSSMIYVDLLCHAVGGTQFSILGSRKFLGVSLSLSCGTLLITALNVLLPKAVEYMQEGSKHLSTRTINGLVVPLFAGGVLLCQLMNFIVIRFTSHSIVTCPHDLDNASRPRKSSHHHHHHHHVHERLPLLDEHSQVHDYSGSGHEHSHSNRDSLAHHDDCVDSVSPEPSPEAFTSAPFPVSEAYAVHSHRSQLESIKSGRSSDLLAIGIQTTLGISVHRVPEGLLLFTASQADRQLGLSIVMALIFHGFSEGFSIAAPLYGALEDRGLVLLISAVLGCGPQIAGAFIGSLIFRDGRQLAGEAKFIFGACMAATAGFMLVVCIQMIGSAYRCTSQTSVLYCVVLGIMLSLGSRAL